MPGNLFGSRLTMLPSAPERCPPLTLSTTIEDAVREADLAIDCVPDELESKLEILWLLDRMAPPRTVFATPTTNLSIADLASCTNRPEKCIAIAASPADLQAGAPSDRSSSLGWKAGATPGLQRNPSRCTQMHAPQVAFSSRKSHLARLPNGHCCSDSALVLRAGPVTSDETVDLVCGFWRRLGFEPVVERSLPDGPPQKFAS